VLCLVNINHLLDALNKFFDIFIGLIFFLESFDLASVGEDCEELQHCFTRFSVNEESAKI